MPKITYFIRANRDTNNTYSLYCRVTYLKTSKEFSTGEKLLKSEWQPKTHKVTSSRMKERFFDTLMATISYSIKSLALLQNFEDAKQLVKFYKTPKKKEPVLVKIIENYIDFQKSRQKHSTIRNHTGKLSNLKNYQKERKETFSATSFSLVEAEKFKQWYIDRANTTNIDTANRNILFFKQALHYASKNGDIECFSIVNYKGEKDPVKSIVYLSSTEVKKINEYNFQSLMLQQISDLFLFQCYTGLAFSDIWSKWNLKESDHGTILTGARTKNGQIFFIPIESEVIKILEKYSYNLPKYSNEVYNRILKEIASIVGIEKRLTSHVGRKTFATLKDIEGWSRETVSAMLGHRSMKTTEIYYLGDSTSRIEKEMHKRNGATYVRHLKKVPGS